LPRRLVSRYDQLTAFTLVQLNGDSSRTKARLLSRTNGSKMLLDLGVLPSKLQILPPRSSLRARNDRYGREKSCADLAGELSEEGIDISASTIRRILKKAGFRKTKPTRKPGLTKKMMETRLQLCLRHKDWTLEDWKVVIWSDDTAVVLLHRRRGYRVWRTAEEQFVRSCIRER
jgi:hypothetical protein